MTHVRRSLKRDIRELLRGENLIRGFDHPHHRPLLCARLRDGAWTVHYRCGCQADSLPAGRRIPIGIGALDYSRFVAADGYFDHEGAREYELYLSARHLEASLDGWVEAILAADALAPALAEAA